MTLQQQQQQHVGAVTSAPLAGAPFGASVDLESIRGRIGPGIADELRLLLANNHVLVFNGELSEAEQVELISCFGRVLGQGPRVVVNDVPTGPFPIVTFVSNDAQKGALGTFELSFHHDLGHVATPLAGISLYAMDVAEGQAPTRFSNGRLAYLALPVEMRERLEGLQSMFSANYTATTDVPINARDIRDQLDPTWPRAVHPLVVPHPITGDRCLYLNEMMTISILGLSTQESDDILDTLLGVLYDDANVYDHHWKVGDLVVWDNLVIQHARRRVAEEEPRTLRRVVFGEKSFWEDWPRQVAS